MSKEVKPKFTTQVGTSLIINPGNDAGKIGAHYVALHDMQTGPAYKELGQTVVTKYKTKKLPNGAIQVNIIEEHY